MFKIFPKLILFSALLLLPAIASASTASLIVQDDNIAVGDEFKIDLLLDTQDKDINAVAGEIILPDSVSFRSIVTGGSVVNFWVEGPENQGKKVVFSGIAPGGFNGRYGFILSLILTADQLGKADIKIDKFQALLNDGQGTADKAAAIGLNIDFKPFAGDAAKFALADQTPPEDFSLQLVRNKDLFDNQWALIFATQDKESGVDHYEAKEGNGEYALAESPYLIKNQNLNEAISIKAVDKAGNIRAAVLPATYAPPLYRYLSIFGVILIIALVLLIGKKLYNIIVKPRK